MARATVWAVGAFIALAAVASTWEGNRSHAYQDSGGRWTICEGHSRGVKAGDTAEPGQCAEYRRSDRLLANAELDGCTSAQLTPNQRDAFVSVAENLGGVKFCASSITRHINSGNIKAACRAIGLYLQVAGKDCRIAASNCHGIIRRRAAEVETCWPSFASVT